MKRPLGQGGATGEQGRRGHEAPGSDKISETKSSRISGSACEIRKKVGREWSHERGIYVALGMVQAVFQNHLKVAQIPKKEHKSFL